MFPLSSCKSTAFGFVALIMLCATPPSHADLTFNLTSTSLKPTDQAYQDFQLAAQRWSSIFTNNITVNLDIEYKNLGANNILGQTSLSEGSVTYASVRAALAANASSADSKQAAASLAAGNSYFRLINHTTENGDSSTPFVTSDSSIFMTSANAKALHFLPASNAALDAEIDFNNQFSFQLDPSKVAGSNQFDFVGVATHEIGHSLGYISSVDDLDTNPGQAASNYHATVLDLFRYSAESTNGTFATNPGDPKTPILDMTADGRAKYFSLDNGKTQGPQFATGQVFGDGDQASHWKGGLGIGIMDPSAAPGEVLQISNNDVRAFNVIGYNISAVPELPLSAMFGLGMSAMGLLLRRRYA